MKNVLITGGSGLVGTRLSQLLLEKGYRVRHLSRKPKKTTDIEVFHWDLHKGEMDPKALENLDYLIHLAGAGVADKKWTPKRKKAIIDSRTQSTALLKRMLAEQAHSHRVKVFLGASGIGYYGDHQDDELLTEESALADDFLAQVCEVWETGYEGIEAMNIRKVVLRIGIVLAQNGGALPKMALPAKMGIGSYFGNGKQYFSWIHLDDLCRMMIFAFENEQVSGVYNAVAPNPVPNKTFARTLSKALGRPFIPAPAPKFALRLALGEMADVVLFGSRVSANKIANNGFDFQYPDLLEALKNIYGK